MDALTRAQQQADEARRREAESRLAYRNGTLDDVLLRRASDARKALEGWQREHDPESAE